MGASMMKTWGRVAVAGLGLLLSSTAVAAGKKSCDAVCDEDVRQCQSICKEYAGRNVAKCQKACADEKEACIEGCLPPPTKQLPPKVLEPQGTRDGGTK